MIPALAESSWEKYGISLNLFPPEYKWVIQKPDLINNKIDRNKMSLLFNETCVYMNINITEKLNIPLFSIIDLF